jgi:hypothetical protein
MAPCCKTNFSEDWSSYWFYVKVDMSKVPGYDGPAHPFSSPIEALTATLLTVKIRQPSHEFTFCVGITFVSYSLVLTPVA